MLTAEHMRRLIAAGLQADQLQVVVEVLEECRPAKTPRKASTDSRTSRIFEGWCVSEDAKQYGITRCGLTPDEINDEAEKFFNYWRADGGRKLDWNIAFKNWLRKSLDYRPRRNPAHAHDSLAAAAHGVLARDQARGIRNRPMDHPGGPDGRGQVVDLLTDRRTALPFE